MFLRQLALLLAYVAVKLVPAARVALALLGGLSSVCLHCTTRVKVEPPVGHAPTSSAYRAGASLSMLWRRLAAGHGLAP